MVVGVCYNYGPFVILGLLPSLSIEMGAKHKFANTVKNQDFCKRSLSQENR